MTYEDTASYDATPPCTRIILQHTATQCNTLHSDTCAARITQHCNTLQHTTFWRRKGRSQSSRSKSSASKLLTLVLHESFSIATCYRTLQHATAHYILKKKRALILFKKRILWYLYCTNHSALQHAATHCSTLHFGKKRTLTIFEERILGVRVADTCVARIRLIALLFEFEYFIFDIRSLCIYIRYITYSISRACLHIKYIIHKYIISNQIDRAPAWIWGFDLRYQETVHIWNI